MSKRIKTYHKTSLLMVGASSNTIQFNATLQTTDPKFHPVLIVGQLRHLSSLRFDQVRVKLEPRVTAETFENAIACLHPSPTDFCPLYLNLATVAALPLNSSRHNTSSRAHALTRLVKTHALTVTESIVIVCDRQDMYASGCAAVRAFPLYSRKSHGVSSSAANSSAAATVVNIEFIFMDPTSLSSSPPSPSHLNLMPIDSFTTLTDDEIIRLADAAYGIRLAAKIVDMPCNEMNVAHFIDEIKAIANSIGKKCTVISGEALRERGMGGLYGVGKGATVPPALVVLSHEVNDATETVAWVGKGIVYDTGGLSIKGKTAMPGMKRDCGGAAAILGAFYAAIRAGFNQNLHAVFCLAENSVGPDATRPDDIHTLYSGRTVEINNTDAEGRLVLADGVVYAQRDLKATIILDMATLTGAQGVATGKHHGAIMTNTEEWELRCLDAGRASGDLLAPIVYCPELHFCEFTSAVADMKNSAADRNNALASCAGLFIASHLGFDFNGVWMHVDMASPVNCGERATGYGVALLLTLFGGWTNSALLQSIAPSGEPPSKKVRFSV